MPDNSAADNRIPLSAGRYDAAAGTWGLAGPAPQNTVRETLTIATFNIWFGDYFQRERHRAVARILERHRPDFIALQEVTADSLRLFLEQDWIRREYSVTDIDGATLGDYGVWMLSRVPPRTITQVTLPSFMRRRLLMLETEINGQPLTVATVHLESLRSSADIRGYQLSAIFETLADAPNAVLMGDFNFCASWPEENDRIDPRYSDTWGFLRPDEPGYTEDSAINRMRRLFKREEKRVRFDRVLLKRGGIWTPSTIELLGTDPIAPDYPDVFPSDHFGLLCRLSGLQGV